MYQLTRPVLITKSTFAQLRQIMEQDYSESDQSKCQDHPLCPDGIHTSSN